MEADSYRQSRLCRLLGNPVAFAVVQLLAENNELNPSEIARAVGRSVNGSAPCSARYAWRRSCATTRMGSATDTGPNTPSEVRSLLGALSRFVKVASVPQRKLISWCDSQK